MSRVRRRSTERGATSVLVAVLIVVIVAILALALNVGHLLSVRGETQNAVDSAALAGALQLNGTAEQLDPARQAASAFAQQHRTDSADPVTVAPSSVLLGRWDYATRSFDPSVTDPALINAVWVGAERSEPVWLARLVGGGPPSPAPQGGGGQVSTEARVGAGALAVTGGPCDAACADLPFVIRAGCVEGKCTPGSGQVSGGIYYVALSSDQVDTAGLTNMLPVVGVNNPAVCGLLTDPNYCTENRPDGTRPNVGNTIDTGNGAQWGSQCAGTGESICELIASRIGTDQELATVPIVTYAGDSPGQCDGKYVEFATIRGWASLRVVLARCKKNGTVRVASDLASRQAELLAPCDVKPAGGGGGGNQEAQVCLALELRCNVRQASASDPGCTWFGTSSYQPKLAPYAPFTRP